jgi:acetolactate synthase I/II/III large subunit
MTTVAEATAELVGEAGIRDFFGLVGSGNFAVTNGLIAGGARFVPARHEGGAIAMADAYARVSGGLGVCTVHQGPGLTNAMTGLTEAVKSRTPLLVLAAETAAAAVNSNFRIDQARLVESVGAVAERLQSPASAAADASRALRRALGERRPVVLMMPLDVQAAEAPANRLHVLAEVSTARPGPAAAAGISRLAEMVARSERPLIIAGRGAVLSGARDALERLGETAGALLATSGVANGFFAGSPWNLGIAGGFATPAATELIRQADLVLAFGASLNMWTTSRGTLIGPDAAVVQVDSDSDAIARHREVTLGLLGDANETALALTAKLQTRGAGWRTQEVADLISRGRWREQAYDDAGGDGRIDPRTLSIALDEMLPRDRAVAVDSGHFMGFPAMYLDVQSPAAFVFAQAFMSVGLGLSGAIGAAVARPDRLTVAAVGDGGLLMSLPELETAARLELGLLVLVYNDAAYGAEVHHFRPHGEPVDSVMFPDTDFAGIGRALGLEGMTVRGAPDLEPLRQWLAGPRGRGLVLDAKVVPSVVGDWLEDAFRGH